MAWWRHTALKSLVNIGPGCGFLPEGTQLFPEPILTSVKSFDIHARAISPKILKIYPWCEFANHKFKITTASSGGQWVNTFSTMSTTHVTSTGININYHYSHFRKSWCRYHGWPSTQHNRNTHNLAAHHRAAHKPAARWCAGSVVCNLSRR